jgi:hypothetical protein
MVSASSSRTATAAGVSPLGVDAIITNEIATLVALDTDS